MRIAVFCKKIDGTYQEQYDSLVWNDGICSSNPELHQNPLQKPTLQEILDSGFIELDINLARKKEKKKELVIIDRKKIISSGVKYASADDIQKTGQTKYVYGSDDHSINRITNVLNNGTSARNWKDVNGKFHLFTHEELQELLNIIIELMEKSFDNEKLLSDAIDNCISEQQVDDLILDGWETVPYEKL